MNWHQYFMGLAFAVSQKSHDEQTKHGCILVDNNKHIIGTGYNGFCRGMPDSQLPKTRPEKYLYMQHSERNCVTNTTVNLWTIQGGATAYITGMPCFDCAQHLWQNNVTKWYLARRQGSTLETAETKERFDWFIRTTGVSITWLEPQSCINWIKNIDV